MSIQNRKLLFSSYAKKLNMTLEVAEWGRINQLAEEIERCWINHETIYICGNGGSAANAIHIANDFIYGIAKKTGGGVKFHALSANQAVVTCLANDVGFDDIFSEQLAVMANPNDLLIVLSGSGNSKNIIKALNQAKRMSVKSCAILGFSGGLAKTIADIPIHFEIEDMQIAEDLQLIVGHMIMQCLWKKNHNER